MNWNSYSTHLANEKLASARLREPPLIALLIKRTYDIDDHGKCHLADEQHPIYEDMIPYEEVPPPRISPPKWDNDLFAFKEMTDVIIQGSAHSYGKLLRETVVRVHFSNISRSIKVYGHRKCVWDRTGHLQFTPPEPFEKIPLRYDCAYGGQDVIALKRYGDPVEETFDFIRPEWKLSTTSPYHYPRNPAGKGFLVEADRESVEAIELPNLEWLEDPITPERLAIGSVKKWPQGPLPAAFDWYEQSWFPRIACLGITPESEVSLKDILEINLGWIPKEVVEKHSCLDQQMHPFFVQGASPGLSIKSLKPNEIFLLENLFPKKPQMVIQLPDEVPEAMIKLPMKGKLDLKPFLNTVAIQSDEGKLIMVWSCRAAVQRPYSPPEFDYIDYQIRWKKG